jgi:hypothetical protein
MDKQFEPDEQTALLLSREEELQAENDRLWQVFWAALDFLIAMERHDEAKLRVAYRRLRHAMRPILPTG